MYISLLGYYFQIATIFLPATTISKELFDSFLINYQLKRQNILYVVTIPADFGKKQA